MFRGTKVLMLAVVALTAAHSLGCGGLIEGGIAYIAYKRAEDKARDMPYQWHEASQDRINEGLARSDPTRRDQFWEDDSDGGVYTKGSRDDRKAYRKATHGERQVILQRIRDRDLPVVQADMLPLQREIERRTQLANSLGRVTGQMLGELEHLKQAYINLEQIAFVLEQATPEVIGNEFHVWNNRANVLAVFGYRPPQFPAITATVVGG